jgi:hypothetical protein
MSQNLECNLAGVWSASRALVLPNTTVSVSMIKLEILGYLTHKLLNNSWHP